MAIELFDSRDLYEMRRDLRLDPVPDYFWKTFFGTDYYSEDQAIRFGELPTPHRKLAPFVMPTSQGKPIFERKGERLTAIEPAYIKAKDAVRVMEARNILPSEIWREGGVPSLQSRFDSRVAEVVAYHLRAIDMTKSWMAARAFIDGKLTIRYHADQGADHPEVTVDFGRDASLNEFLSGQFIDDPDFPLVDFLSDLSATMYNAKFGARPTRWIVGSAVAPYITKNKQLLALLNTQIRGGESTTVTRGLFNVAEPLSYIATVGGMGAGIEIWTYKDTVQAPDGSMVDLFDPRDGLLVAPGAGGIMAHGAIYDIDAFEGGNISVDVFPKMIRTGDPGDIFVMHQSSPLPVNTEPNKVSHQRLLA